jgi:adenine-specific DNA-methyltransferase
MDYSSLSKDLTNKLPSAVKKENGIYFTPPSCITNNINLLKPYMSEIKSVLEPSCGSGEFITSLQSQFPNTISITGIELNDTIYNSILHLAEDGTSKGSNVKIIKQDFLNYSPGAKFDLIIGNPPFYVMKKDMVDEVYYPYFVGRPNIFILFIIKSLELLNDNGILSFILPKNFLNCLYYDKTRKFICDNFQILHIIECHDKFLETQQETIMFIVRKKSGLKIDNTKFALPIDKYTVFVLDINMAGIIKLYEKSKTLFELGFTVSVGTVVWNQCKEILTDDVIKTRLIYCSDIVDNKLSIKKYKSNEKKNYIDKPGLAHPMIVINRGYGVGEYKFNYCLIDTSSEYLIENHLICIEFNKENIGSVKKDELIKMYNKVIKSLNDKRTQEFINLYFGNNAINTTELNYILPIYYDI